MASGEDSDDATMQERAQERDATRLERALERIAVLARQRPDVPAGQDTAVPVQEVTARLDALIAQLRGAIDRPE